MSGEQHRYGGAVPHRGAGIPRALLGPVELLPPFWWSRARSRGTSLARRRQGAQRHRSRAMPEPRHQPADLIDLAASLLGGAGIAADRDRLIAELLVEADLMGHT